MVKAVMLRRLIIMFLLPLLTVPAALGAGSLALPELGGGSIKLIGDHEEDEIGRSILNELRRSNLVLDDPEINEYLQHLGSRLVAAVDNDQTRFTFFVVKDDSINAFALPGGYIGLHSGLVLRTRSESELASVVAHEIAHVTQRHIKRRFDAAAGMNLKGLAVMLGAIALAASGSSPQNVSGALMLGQGLAMQGQINFTRSQEYEADRVGVGILARGGFDPDGMVSFFETMQRSQRLQNSRMPEFLSTHPLSLSRVSEAAQRVQAMEDRTFNESRSYPLIKARLGVLSGADPLLLSTANEQDANAAARYARALDLMSDGPSQTAIEILRDLRKEDDSIIHYHTALGDALLEAGRVDEALAVFERASMLFPDSIPVGLAHAEALRYSGDAASGLRLLRGLFNQREPLPEHTRRMAQLAAAAGSMDESHYYMAEYYLQTGDFGSARVQLELAIDRADPASTQVLKYTARLQEVSEALLAMRHNDPRRGASERRPRR